MMNKFTCCSEESPDKTSFNDPPVGLRRISEKEFAQSFMFTYTPKYSEYRQIHVKSDKELIRSTDFRNSKMITLHMYWFHDGTGIAMHNDYWAGKIEYFAFGCNHEYHELGQDTCRARGIYHAGHCYHVAECSKCKYIWSYDSSD